MNVQDREQLKRSVDHWRIELAHRTRTLTRAQKASEGAHKAVQQAKAVIDRRERQLARITDTGRRAAVSRALGCVGVTEHPAGSNAGPMIDQWQQRFHMIGQPWCGAFVGAMCEMAGAKLTDRIVYTPYIHMDADAHRNGLDGVVWRRGKGMLLAGVPAAHSADLVLFDFASPGIKHVGMLVKPWPGWGLLQTVEGNTSFGNGGSQDNGGAVARRQRDPVLVHSIVRVRWP